MPSRDAGGVRAKTRQAPDFRRARLNQRSRSARRRRPQPRREGAPPMTPHRPLSRRALLQGAATSAALAGIGTPAIVRAQADAIRIGHLTPLTGFLGPLGEFAQMGVRLAAEEINAAGGVMERKIELVMEDSVNPQTASAKAERLIERDKVAMIIGDLSSASGLAIGQV